MSLQPVESKPQQLLRWLGRLERGLSIAAFAVLAGVLLADVVSRELTGAGLTWARAIGGYANLFLMLAGIGLASAGGSHLRPRFADHWLPARLEPLLVRCQEVVMALFCAGVAVVAAAAVQETWRLGERSATPDWPVWPFQLVIPLVFGLAVLRHACFAAWPALRPADDVAPLDVTRAGRVP
jgi:TRAP-type C4-dicarboxylate transport system permease small subunit